MKTLDRFARGNEQPAAAVVLTYEQRRKSRQLLRLDDGSEAALTLPRGMVLRDGDCVAGPDGLVVSVRAAEETLSAVRVAEPLALARAAYHLGNRHVALQITGNDLRYLHDHVLDAMVRALGMEVETVEAPFQPEGGAYEHHHGP